jgi:hypothetical protein
VFQKKLQLGSIFELAKNQYLVLFFSLWGLSLLSKIFVNTYIVTDDVIVDFLDQRLSLERISHVLEQREKWRWLTYFTPPIYYLLKFLLISICFLTGSLFLRVEKSFEKFFPIIIKAEFILLVPAIVKLFWFSLYQTNYRLDDLQYFSPLSIFSLFNPTEVDAWLAYPLQLLNLFEFLYWLALAYQLKEVLGKSFFGCFRFVASTYGVGLLIWVVLVMFLTVSIS